MTGRGEIRMPVSAFLVLVATCMLLAFLSNDLTIDYYADLSTQHGYYCTLLHSMETIPGVMRLLVPCGMLAVGVIASQRLSLLVVSMAGLPLLLRNLMLVHSACLEDPKLWISSELKMSHGYMLVLFTVILVVVVFEQVDPTSNASNASNKTTGSNSPDPRSPGKRSASNSPGRPSNVGDKLD